MNTSTEDRVLATRDAGEHSRRLAQQLGAHVQIGIGNRFEFQVQPRLFLRRVGSPAKRQHGRLGNEAADLDKIVVEERLLYRELFGQRVGSLFQSSDQFVFHLLKVRRASLDRSFVLLGIFEHEADVKLLRKQSGDDFVFHRVAEIGRKSRTFFGNHGIVDRRSENSQKAIEGRSADFFVATAKLIKVGDQFLRLDPDAINVPQELLLVLAERLPRNNLQRKIRSHIRSGGSHQDFENRRLRGVGAGENFNQEGLQELPSAHSLRPRQFRQEFEVRGEFVTRQQRRANFRSVRWCDRLRKEGLLSQAQQTTQA